MALELTFMNGQIGTINPPGHPELTILKIGDPDSGIVVNVPLTTESRQALVEALGGHISSIAIAKGPLAPPPRARQ